MGALVPVRALRQRWIMGRGECFVFCFVLLGESIYSSGEEYTTLSD